MLYPDKFSNLGISIFPEMSALAQKHNAINLAQGFPGFGVDQALIELVNKYMHEGKNQYSPMPGVKELRETISKKQELLYQSYYCPDKEITITAGATEAVFCAISTIIEEGDEVICFEPVFDIYPPAIKLNKGVVVPIKLNFPDYQYDWELVKSRITSRTKLIILNSPHNPVGKTLSASDLEAIADITRDTDILILSDEVYEHMVFDQQKHHSVCTHPELKAKSFIVLSLGKVLHCTGWRIGYCLAPEGLMNSYRKIHQFVTFSAGTPVQYAMAEYLSDPSSWQNLPDFFQSKRDFFAEKLKNSGFQLTKTAGSYFQLAEYSNLSNMNDITFARHLTSEFGVASIPVSVFYQDRTDNKIIRFCFAKNDTELEEACKRLEKINK